MQRPQEARKCEAEEDGNSSEGSNSGGRGGVEEPDEVEEEAAVDETADEDDEDEDEDTTFSEVLWLGGSLEREADWLDLETLVDAAEGDGSAGMAAGNGNVEGLEDMLRRQLVLRSLEPRAHQIDLVARLLRHLAASLPAQTHNDGDEAAAAVDSSNFLVQHAPGSGKSVAIALLVDALLRLRLGGRPAFARVLILTDRVLLEAQLTRVLARYFTAPLGPEARWPRAPVPRLVRARSAPQLEAALAPSASPERLVVTTLQKFGRLLLQGEETLRRRRGDERICLICDEAHRSHGRALTRRLHAFLTGASRQDARLTYISFTATPTARALRLFGRPSGPDGRERVPFHAYPLSRAIEEGVILSPLQRYLCVELGARLQPRAGHEETPVPHPSLASEWLAEQAAPRLLAAPEIREKARFVVRHLAQLRREFSGSGSGGLRPKAMLLAASRAHVVAYRDELVRAQEELALPAEEAWRTVCFFAPFQHEGRLLREEDVRANGPDARRLLREYAVEGSGVDLAVAAEKLGTGFDLPALLVLYLDRPLRGATAVQTLGRLVRSAPGKPLPIVVDFRASRHCVRRAFQAFWHEARLSALANPAPAAALPRLRLERSVLASRLLAFLDRILPPGSSILSRLSREEVSPPEQVIEEPGSKGAQQKQKKKKIEAEEEEKGEKEQGGGWNAEVEAVWRRYVALCDLLQEEDARLPTSVLGRVRREALQQGAEQGAEERAQLLQLAGRVELALTDAALAEAELALRGSLPVPSEPLPQTSCPAPAHALPPEEQPATLQEVCLDASLRLALARSQTLSVLPHPHARLRENPDSSSSSPPPPPSARDATAAPLAARPEAALPSAVSAAVQDTAPEPAISIGATIRLQTDKKMMMKRQRISEGTSAPPSAPRSSAAPGFTRERKRKRKRKPSDNGDGKERSRAAAPKKRHTSPGKGAQGEAEEGEEVEEPEEALAAGAVVELEAEERPDALAALQRAETGVRRGRGRGRGRMRQERERALRALRGTCMVAANKSELRERGAHRLLLESLASPALSPAELELALQCLAALARDSPPDAARIAELLQSAHEEAQEGTNDEGSGDRFRRAWLAQLEAAGESALREAAARLLEALARACPAAQFRSSLLRADLLRVLARALALPGSPSRLPLLEACRALLRGAESHLLAPESLPELLSEARHELLLRVTDAISLDHVASADARQAGLEALEAGLAACPRPDSLRSELARFEPLRRVIAHALKQHQAPELVLAARRLQEQLSPAPFMRANNRQASRFA
jgi:superfamily II DNA or RNA helicase